MFDTSTTTVITREQFLDMTPSQYLRAGFRDEQGRPRRELASIYATAGATQLESLTGGELGTTLIALAQSLPLHDGTPAERYHKACNEAGELAAGVRGAQPSPDLARWLEQFTPFLQTEQDLLDAVTHLAVVARQHALFAGMRATRA
ncbi:MAG TPA: hypothetical protein VH475_04430 [Tepidisphaeraceae bacterium]|jgi:hypothetical protein